MKKVYILLALAAVLTFITTPAQTQENSSGTCRKISDGGITYRGKPITSGYNKWGCNFEGHIFNGIYDNHLMPEPPLVVGDNLIIKWNEAWLSSKNCNPNPSVTELDRNNGSRDYRGTGAWITNHATGTYLENGFTCKWSDFAKVVAVPKEAQLDSSIMSPKCKPSLESGFDGYMWRLGGKELGCSMWSDSFDGLALIQEISSDPCGKKEHLLNYRTQSKFGLGGN